MNLREILKKWLKDNGYDGLCRTETTFTDDCSCKGKDLLYCHPSIDPGECEPGYLVKNPSDDFEYLIKPKKED